MDQQNAEPEFKAGAIFEAIPAITGKLDAIKRERRNQQQGFNYRGIDDLYNALSPLMAEHKIFSVPSVLSSTRTERATKSGGVQFHVALRIRYRFFAQDGSYFDAILEGEGMDSGDKASNKAESVAHKYALTQVFTIRTEDQSKEDPDSDSPAPSAKSNTKKPSPPPPAEPPKKSPPGTTVTQTPANQKKISQDQIKRLFTIAREARWPDAELRRLIQGKTGQDSTKGIPWTCYNEICKWVQANPFPEKG